MGQGDIENEDTETQIWRQTHENPNPLNALSTGHHLDNSKRTGNRNEQLHSKLYRHARADGQTDAFAEFLTGAAPLVKETEPGTELWFALQADDTLAIFDIFVSEEARNAHFSGAVAGALNQNADTFVAGGWDAGVVANINNSNVLSVKAPVDLYSATTATYIRLEAAPGQSDQLAALLTAAGPIVAETEPKTLFWAAVQIDENNFAIFDIFADNSGREAHFAGKVASLLNEQASVLVTGGWDEGVVANVSNFDILAIK